MKIKNLLFIIILTSYLSVPIFSSPSRFKWERELFIGYNRTHYYTFLIINKNPGSHYTGYKYFYICKYLKKSRKLKSRILIRKTKLDSSHSGNTFKSKLIEYINKSFNLTNYFIKNKIVFSFPDYENIEKNYTLNKNGLFMKQNKKFTKILDGKLFIKDYWAINRRPKILSIFSCDINSYYVISYGFGGDTGFYQNVIAIKNKNTF